MMQKVRIKPSQFGPCILNNVLCIAGKSCNNMRPCRESLYIHLIYIDFIFVLTMNKYTNFLKATIFMQGSCNI